VQLIGAVERHFEAVLETGQPFFERHAAELASACWGMARRFHQGGRLLVYAEPGAAFSDAQHNAVEFIHPVLVGKRALPAVSVGDPSHLILLARGDDISMGITSGDLARLPAGLQIAFGDAGECDAEHAFRVAAGDALVAQEIQETAYHELWELVHVFFEHEGLLAQGCTDDVCLTCGDVALPAAVIRAEGSSGLVRTAQGDEEADLTLVQPITPGELVLVHGGVALERVKPIEQFSQEFYPFLSNQEVDVPAVLADVTASVRMKWEEVAALRRAADLAVISEAATALRQRVEAGGAVLAFGNGGSATDAADLASDLRAIGVRAFDLAGEPAVVTAIGNDIGFVEVFARQVIPLGKAGDVAIGISTSGRSGNILNGLRQARRQGLMTIALAGYGGGEMLREESIDFLLVTDSTYIPRIQEAQATMYHALIRGLEASDWRQTTGGTDSEIR
jgi:D-sedoheptulose 7-phosphate isomerase